ncbi:MAG: elongation factor Ts [Deltaproteobacteria bacterium]|jgi:elongation factor Ts|nr:elongation factor Ts [Deltaproteobacteria bacterium]MBW2537852.1 elongation factor Ts [Deltaproteobacteria bacterium]
MATIDVKAIKELRERTQAGMTDCKNALVEAEGDMDQAVEIILKKGLAKSAKRAGAIAAEGEVRAAVADGGRSAALVEVNIQTDFAARNEKFQAFVAKITDLALTMPPDGDINGQQIDGQSVADAAVELGAKLGEKVAVRRAAQVALAEGQEGFCHCYIHMGGKIAVVVVVATDGAATAEHPAARKFADDTAMHVAAMNPLALKREDVDPAEVAKQKEIFEAQLRDDPKPKPEKVWPKIIEGKIQKWFSEVALLEQESVVVPKSKIDDLRKAAATEAGGTLEIVRFARFERGEGIAAEKKDLAADVEQMLT